MTNLVTGEFKGEILPVNPRRSSVMGLPAFSSVENINKDVDIAIIATPITTVPEIVESCARANMAGVTILSAGGKEIGEKGEKIETDIMHNAQKKGLRIIGPNCLGFMNTGKNLNASFAQESPLPGKIAFISQSGAVCTSILDLAKKENVGFSHVVSLGSMIDVDFADMIDYFGTISDVKSIIMYVENITNIRNFMSAARAVSRVKPIIALKSGRSEAGARAAASHTGALAGEDAVYDAAFKRAGILRVNEFEELFDCAEFLAKQNRPRGARLAVVTNAGGPGVMAADALAAYDVEPAELSNETIKKLDELLPQNWSRGNPVDIVGDSSPEKYIKAAEICIEASETDGLLIINSPAGTIDSVSLAQSFAEFLQKASCPVFTSWIGGQNIDKAREIFNKAGVVTYESPERAVRAFMNLYQYGRNLEMLQEIPVRKDKKLLINKVKAEEIITNCGRTQEAGLTEIEAKNLLKAYGIPVNRTELAISGEGAAEIAAKMGFPVALKICSREILHKSDSGGVILNLGTGSDVKDAFRTIIKKTIVRYPDADIMGVTVQTMHTHPDYELIVGAKKDKDFGPVVVFGMGGVMTEIFRDVSMALPPLNHLLAGRVIEETKISRVLKGYRNIKKVDVSLLEEILIRVGRLVTDFPEIEELDINPMIVKNGELMAVDARVVIKKSKITPPMHLVISSYPWCQEAFDATIDNEQFF
ncbi:MAG: acetate--CoA ligase family protein, partial [Thermodesulfobacteriota bacterium]|nr:acetate--CoA ligase family protein [Thermodesulfobacteriota bacterium]